MESRKRVVAICQSSALHGRKKVLKVRAVISELELSLLIRNGHLESVNIGESDEWRFTRSTVHSKVTRISACTPRQFAFQQNGHHRCFESPFGIQAATALEVSSGTGRAGSEATAHMFSVQKQLSWFTACQAQES
jgi:hypothetical protein